MDTPTTDAIKEDFASKSVIERFAELDPEAQLIILRACEAFIAKDAGRMSPDDVTIFDRLVAKGRAGDFEDLFDWLKLHDFTPAKTD